MEFRTSVDIQEQNLRITHQSRLMMFGSCFAQNVGKLLVDSKFNVNVNPFGILYNPSSVSNVIRRIVAERPFTKRDLKECNGLYVSFLHHGDFSSADISECLPNMNESLDKAVADLQHTDTIVITFGTSYVYKSIDTGEIVSNCHKFPASAFERSRLSVEDIVEDWSDIITMLRIHNPKVKFLFTVSPVRHWKDGAHDNQLSKSILLLAIDQIQKSHKEIYYFPSYEVMMDELRDYRFYADDMIHPSQMAIKYIWQLFGKSYFEKETESIINEWDQLNRALQHRPFNPSTDEHKQFLRQTLLKLESFQHKYAYLNCSEDIEKTKLLLQ